MKENMKFMKTMTWNEAMKGMKKADDGVDYFCALYEDEHGVLWVKLSVYTSWEDVQKAFGLKNYAESVEKIKKLEAELTRIKKEIGDYLDE